MGEEKETHETKAAKEMKKVFIVSEEKQQEMISRIELNIADYYSAWHSPIKISILLRPYQTLLSRLSMGWNSVEDELRKRGSKVICSPRNVKYVFPRDAIGLDEELREQILSIEKVK